MRCRICRPRSCSRHGLVGRPTPGTRSTIPCCIGPDGLPIETWREGYPYDQRMDRTEYEARSGLLQIELLKAQAWIREHRPEAGDPVRGARRRRQGRHDQAVPGAPQPARRHRGRLVGAERARAGSVVLPALRPPPADPWRDRPVRPVLVQPGRRRAGDGLLHRRRVRRVPAGGPASSRRCSTRSGTTLVKLWFSVSRREQIARFTIRRIDPVRQWKLSPMDLASLDRWDDYTAAKEAMFRNTHTDARAVDGRAQQRQEARPARSDPLRPATGSTTPTRTPSWSARPIR